MWRGRGRLTNTLSGATIAEVDFLERVKDVATGDDEGAKFGSERVVVYKTFNGTRPTQPLRYAHNVSVGLANGSLLLRASGGRGVVASGWSVGRGPSRLGLRRAYDVSVRPKARDAASSEPAPISDQQAGWPRAANRGALSTTREEYRVLGPRRPGGCRELSYRRTGRCPTWYGPGVCTLGVEARIEPAPLRWCWRRWRRLAAGKPASPGAEEEEEAWEQRVRELVGSPGQPTD